MNRLERFFAESRSTGRKALVVYVCAGDPDLATTERLVPELAKAGADIIELGVPFSDPLADGPTIQAASQRALQSGTTLSGVLGLVRRLRRGGCQVPLVLFGYVNPILRMGLGPFVAEATEAGADGLLVADLPLEESSALGALAMASGLSLVLLAAPTTLRPACVPLARPRVDSSTSSASPASPAPGLSFRATYRQSSPRSAPRRTRRWRWASASRRRSRPAPWRRMPTPWWFEAPSSMRFTGAARTRAVPWPSSGALPQPCTRRKAARSASARLGGAKVSRYRRWQA